MRRPLQHETGELGELRVAQCFIEHGWIVNKLHSDYGFDYLVQPVDGQVVLPQFALIQVKSVRSRHRSGGVRVSPKHMELWHSCPIPCFLVIVDLLDGWIYIRDAKAILYSPDGMEETTDIKHSHTFRFPIVQFPVSQQIDEMRQMVRQYWDKVSIMTLGAGAAVHLPIHYLTRVRDISTLRSELRPLIGEELAEKVRFEYECQ